MQAVIMAGGKGTRLASVTRNIPKPMVPIQGKPLLEYQVENLRESGVDRILIIVGYLGDVIRSHFGDGSRFGVSITYFSEETPLGTAGALRLVKEQLEEDFILVFGDLFINVDFARFLSAHRRSGGLITLFVHPNSHPQDSDILAATADGRVTEWSRKNTERTRDYRNLVNAGLYVLSKNALGFLPEEEKIDLEKQLILPLIEKGRVYAYRSTEYVKDIGTPERLLKVEADLERHLPQARNLNHPQRAIFLDRDGTLNRYVGFLRSKEQLELEEGAAEAVRLINSSEYLAVVITNQPVIARGEVTRAELDGIHSRMEMLLGKEGAYIDGLYYCPHHPDKGYPGEIPELKIDCNCRKPKTGLIDQASRELHIDQKQSWIIGDTGQDILTGKNAGLRTVLVDTGDPDKFRRYRAEPDLRCRNLLEAVQRILAETDPRQA